MSKYEVYVACYEGKVMYVGEGKSGRHQHLTSGISHCYYANKYHFMGRLLDVDVVSEYNTKKEASEEEKRLIQELNPEWNKVVHKGESVANRHKTCDFLIKAANITCKKQKALLYYVSKRSARCGKYVVTLQELVANIPDISSALMSRLASEQKYYKKLQQLIKVRKISKSEYEISWRILPHDN